MDFTKGVDQHKFHLIDSRKLLKALEKLGFSKAFIQDVEWRTDFSVEISFKLSSPAQVDFMDGHISAEYEGTGWLKADIKETLPVFKRVSQRPDKR